MHLDRVYRRGSKSFRGSVPQSLLVFEKDRIRDDKSFIALADYNQLDRLLIYLPGSIKSAFAEGLCRANLSRDYKRTNRPVIIFLRDSWEMFVNNNERSLDIT